jgi:hypothetical protein
MTEGYKIMKMLDGYGLVIHFYESDIDYPQTYSCREVMTVKDKKSFDNLLIQYCKDAHELANCLLIVD